MLKSIWWRITIPYALIIVLATLGLSLWISNQARRARLDDLESRLHAEAALIAADLETQDTLTGSDGGSLQGKVDRWAVLLAQRVTVIGSDGVVLAESHADPATMENHLFRPEVQQALSVGRGSATRLSQTLRHEVMYVAVAIRRGDAVVGVARTALPLAEVEASVGALSRSIVLAGSLTALVALALSTYVAARIVTPIRRLTEAVERVAAGDLSRRLLLVRQDEIGTLTRAVNHMVDQLQDQVATLALERARLSAVLEHMADGVIITDEAGTVVMINSAAANILRYDETRAVGRRFAQVAHSSQLIDLWNRCVETGEEQTEAVETVLDGSFVYAVFTPLRATDPPRYLVMLQDLTHIRRLETIRRDFISNISHELRTPLASLALVVETLRDGAIEDPPAARRFVTHMETELASLTQMVEELLELSRIESGRVPLDIKPTRVRKLIQKPLKRLQPQAERKGVELSASVPEDLPRVRADAKRIQQVVTNLVHNAIKFTPSGGKIQVSAWRGDAPELGAEAVSSREVVIAVEDTGIGIRDVELPRIFERFYKTDRARAHDGTGLGLAIAKHIVQGHGGRIWVKSLEGVGSTFCFSLPEAVLSPDDRLPDRPAEPAPDVPELA